jgi:hypothetical protein
MADTSNSKLFKASFSKRHSSIISDIYGEEIFKEKFDIEKVNAREQLYYKKMIEMKDEMKEEMKEKIKKVLGKEDSDKEDSDKDDSDNEDNQYKHLKSFHEFKNFIETLKKKQKSSDQA